MSTSKTDMIFEIIGIVGAISLFLAIIGTMIWCGIKANSREINAAEYSQVRQWVNKNNELRPFVEEYMKKGKITAYDYRRLDCTNDSLYIEKQKSKILSGDTTHE